MSESLISMQCNHVGWSSVQRAAQFGIVSYDWSNAKAIWAAAKPMTCEQALNLQAVAAKQAGTKHVFVYRNVVKALPWFETTRQKLDDPAYAGFFLRFDPNQAPSQYHVPTCAAENQTYCSPFYHDQEQTPQVPTSQNPKPDGKCVGYCDCGVHPCGEYLFDHRNGTMLRDFLVQEVVLGALLYDDNINHTTHQQQPRIVDGLFLDDYWCSDLLCNENPDIAGCPCDDPVQGPTEIDRFSQFDMGLTDEDIRDITIEWNMTMTAIEQALLDHQAYTWSLLPGQENANAQPLLLTPDTCATLLQQACDPNALWQRLPLLFGFSVTNGTILTQLHEDLAFFLLARGEYAYAGWGVWGMTWPFNPEPRHGTLPPLPHGVPLPHELLLDYGVPQTPTCTEVEPGIFAREWTSASVRLDCGAFQSSIQMLAQKQETSTTT